MASPGLFDFIPGPSEPEKPKAQGLLRPSFVKRAIMNIDQWFDVPALWEHVRTQRKGAPHGGRVEIPVVQITHPGLDENHAAIETAYFFAKDKEIANMDTRRAWDRVLAPLLDEIEEALNAKKPKELPGRLRFDVAPDSSLTLYYIER